MFPFVSFRHEIYTLLSVLDDLLIV